MNKDVKNFLTDYLNVFPVYELNEDDKKQLNRITKAEWLYGKLTRKKFRKAAVHTDTEIDLKKRIAGSIETNTPIKIVIPFGGFKHYWNPSQPEADWADIFNIRFIAEWVAPVLAIHSPGVEVEYFSEDVILPRMNNYPPEAIETYTSSFSNLIEFYSKIVPSNLVIKLTRAKNVYDGKRIIEVVEAMLPERRAAFEKLTPEEKERELKRSKRSIYWNGWKDLSKLSENEKEERIIESRLIELAFYETEDTSDFLDMYYVRDNNICICFSFGLSHDNVFNQLTLGTTFASIVDFWIGRGVLLLENGKFVPTILSHQQYEDSKKNIEDVSGIIPGKNFEIIEIVTK
jgi:hypothetical protein